MKEYEGICYSDDFKICYGPHNLECKKALTNLKLHKDCIEIADNAFQGSKNLEKIEINNKFFETIGKFAFANCEKLKDITIISNKEIFIDFNAFQNTKIENLKLSNFSYTYDPFNKKAFKNVCLEVFENFYDKSFFMPSATDTSSNLENIIIINKELDPDTIFFNFEGGKLELNKQKSIIIKKQIEDFIYKTTNESVDLIAYPPAKKDETIHIPTNITHILNNSFILNPYIKNIYIEKPVKYIDHEAFNKLDNLETIIIKSDDVYLEQDLIKDCYSLKNIYLTEKAYEKNKERIKYNPIFKIITLDVLLDEGHSFKNINNILKDIKER